MDEALDLLSDSLGQREPDPDENKPVVDKVKVTKDVLKLVQFWGKQTNQSTKQTVTQSFFLELYNELSANKKIRCISVSSSSS